MTARGLGLALLMLAASAAGPAVADETCASGSGGQYAKGIQVCVSSVLARQGETNYGPDHLTTGETSAWCEGAAGRGIGETITLRADGGVPFRRLAVNNGYASPRRPSRAMGGSRRSRSPATRASRRVRPCPTGAMPATW